ncbi:ATPase [Pleurocapsales cyanobacterium LEGE 06147]|nr:ATPase [Pleurocapsales cyanobacterium LEGE 06147]
MTPSIVKRFLIACQQHQLLGVFIFLFCLGVSGIIALQPSPPKPSATYKATGQLSYSNPPPLFTSTGEQLQQQGREVGINIIQSPLVLEKVREQLQLSGQQLQEIVEKKLTIDIPEQKENNQLITLEYNNSATAEEGVRFLGIFMKEAIEQSRLLNTSQLRNRIQALKERSIEVQQELATAEEAYYQFITTEGAPLLAVQDGSLFNGLTGSQQQQRQLQLMLEEIDGQIASLIDQLGLNPKEAYTAAALSADPILANLRGQILQNEAQIKLIEKDLRPEHPTMVDLRKRQQANEQLFRERAAEVLGGDGKLKPLPSQLRQDSSLDPARQQLANTLITLQTQREGVQRQLESVKRTERQLRQQYEQFPNQQLQQTRLGQEVETQKALYQTILTALVDAQSAEAETTSSLAIAQAPQYQELLPSTFASTNRLLILAAGGGLGLIAAAGIIFLLATLDDRLYTAREIQDLLSEREVPLLGKIPYVSCYDFEGKETSILMDVDSLYLTFYERVRSNLRRFGSQSSKVILITSVSQEEGKSLTAYNLAIASANAGKRTLLLEADLRSPSLADTVRLEPLPKYNDDPLNYYGDRGETIRLVPGITNLYLVPSLGPLRQVAAIIESNELRRLIEDARGRFDVVVIDSPSLSKCNDALLLESITDGIILVTRPGISRASMLGETIDQFTETEIPLLGAVINGSEAINLPDSYAHRTLSREDDNQLQSSVT